MSEQDFDDVVIQREAPLVHLVNMRVENLDAAQLQESLRQLREMRSSPQTARAKTDRKTRKSQVDISSML